MFIGLEYSLICLKDLFIPLECSHLDLFIKRQQKLSSAPQNSAK